MSKLLVNCTGDKLLVNCAGTSLLVGCDKPELCVNCYGTECYTPTKLAVNTGILSAAAGLCSCMMEPTCAGIPVEPSSDGFLHLKEHWGCQYYGGGFTIPSAARVPYDADPRYWDPGSVYDVDGNFEIRYSSVTQCYTLQVWALACEIDLFYTGDCHPSRLLLFQGCKGGDGPVGTYTCQDAGDGTCMEDCPQGGGIIQMEVTLVEGEDCQPAP